MALIDAEYAALGTAIEIGIRKNKAQAQVISKRFLTKNYKKS
jgi:aminomethyltransferase